MVLNPGTLILFLFWKSYSSLSSIRFFSLVSVASLSEDDAFSSNLTKDIALLLVVLYLFLFFLIYWFTSDFFTWINESGIFEKGIFTYSKSTKSLLKWCSVNPSKMVELIPDSISLL